jgi:glucose/arabinose dehydrogenase/mono/diheme cytochrome c family protein
MNSVVKNFRKLRFSWLYVVIFSVFFAVLGFTLYQTTPKLPPGDKNNAGLILPDGFEALAVVDSLPGMARHLAVSSNGDIYVKSRYHARNGGFGNIAMRDVNNDGKADIITPFGKYENDISVNQQYGTAMRIHKGYLYYSSTLVVYRQKLTPGELVPTSPVEVIVRDTGSTHIHQTKPVAFDGKGYMYVGWGAGSDDCQTRGNPTKGMGKAEPEIPGEGCPFLKDHGGIWKFSEDTPNQGPGDGLRYATGLRSIVGMDWDTKTNALYAVMHGRDNFTRPWPTMYSPWESAMLPADEMFKVTKGMDGGWPYYYYDQMQKKKFLNPEYGGDKKKEAPARIQRPILGFPGHFAPNDIMFYHGNQFPARYKDGAFVILHGSTIRNPYPQAGYFVMFVPMKNGVVSGEWEVFANGFILQDPVISANTAGYRPMGLAEGPDGSLYVSETEKGKIWRIMFKGNKATFGAAQLAKMVKNKATASNVKTPDKIKDNVDLILGKPVVGAAIYTTYCRICHQPNGMGDGTRFPPLGGSEWVNGDKTRLIGVVLNGLQGNIQVKGLPYNEIMPPHSSIMNDEQIAQVLTYVRSNFGNTSGAITAQEVAAVRKAAAK